MKYSIYNSIIPVSSRSSLLYNALTDSFIVFNSKFANVIKEGFTQTQCHNLNLAQMLLDTKCYIDDDVDEFNNLKAINNSIIENESSYFIIINPTLSCNFNCWYCYETHIKKSSISKETENKILLLLKNIIRENKNLQYFTLSFFGGEPLLKFSSIVLSLIEYHNNLCNDNNIKTGYSFTSNGSLASKHIISKLSKYENMSFQITLDGDEKTHNEVRFF